MKKTQIEKAIKGKQIMVTGGTGSFGKEIVQELFQYKPGCVHIFSRDEKKQYEMQHEFMQHGCMNFSLGDVRDYERVRESMRGMDIVFHAAALKQVPNCEWSPYEAARTNVEGAENVRRAAIDNKIQSLVAISTDKAVKPVNVMGMTKAIQERIMLHPANGMNGTKFTCVRYGNVLGSRGSVVPLFCDFIRKGDPLRITHPDMTRFQLTLNEAVQLVLWATVKGESGDLWVRKMPSANVFDLGRVLAWGITGRDDYPIEIIGTRPGEKMHEVLVSEEEMWRATEFEEHFMIPSWAKSQDKPGVTEGPFNEYSSENVHRLTDDEIFDMLCRDGWLSKNGGQGPKAGGRYGNV